MILLLKTFLIVAPYWFQVFRRRISAAAGLKSGQSNRNRNFEKTNVEGMYSVYFKKKTEQSDSTLRHSAVRYSIFCGSLFRPPEAFLFLTPET